MFVLKKSKLVDHPLAKLKIAQIMGSPPLKNKLSWPQLSGVNIAAVHELS